ncbi:DUF1353 domain-containing protein [Parvularcula sp. IMCC14364]|uniref:DUF1353 domain-containing protein n=1 Tax=Parvularcula sp. IMCC14364 TaxID=3067902 RepID=UPI002741FE44|nr:DUF1353 domain-containing protein [Parvularcula sp. IMCC14364]
MKQRFLLAALAAFAAASLTACANTRGPSADTRAAAPARDTITQDLALPPELAAFADERTTPDEDRVDDTLRQDPFGGYQRNRSLEDQILLREQNDLRTEFTTLAQNQQETLTRKERARLEKTFAALVDLIMENLIFDSRDPETGRIDFSYRDDEDSFALELDQRALTREEALEILCLPRRAAKQLAPFDCAVIYALIPPTTMNAFWNEEFSAFEIPITDFPDQPLRMWPYELVSFQNKPFIFLPNESLYGDIFILGTYDENGARQFALSSIPPPAPAAPPPVAVLSGALQELYDQLAVVSDEDDDADLLRDGTRRNFVLKEDILYCREKTGEIFLIPAGFVTDLLSVKGMSAFLRSDRTYAGAIIHDWLFAIGGGEAERKRAEAMFSEELAFNKSGALHRFFITMGTDKVGPLYFRLFGKDSPFGRRAEMRFATRESCQRGYAMQTGEEPYIRGRINQRRPEGQRCRGFQDNYQDYFETYATDTRIDASELTSSDEKRAYLRSVIVNKDPEKSCADL